MNYSNRCPKCGGVAKHLVTDIAGRPYYKCMTGLTTFYNREEELTRSSNIRACETIIDSAGKVVTGTIAYNTTYYVGSKLRLNIETIGVTEGKERG